MANVQAADFLSHVKAVFHVRPFFLGGFAFTEHTGLGHQVLEKQGLVHNVDVQVFQLLYQGIHDGIVVAVRQGHQQFHRLPVGHQDAPGVEDFLGDLADHGDLGHLFLLEGLKDFPYLADVDGVERICFFGQVFMGAGHQGNHHGPVPFLFGAPDHIHRQVAYTGQYA